MAKLTNLLSEIDYSKISKDKNKSKQKYSTFNMKTNKWEDDYEDDHYQKEFKQYTEWLRKNKKNKIKTNSLDRFKHKSPKLNKHDTDYGYYAGQFSRYFGRTYDSPSLWWIDKEKGIIGTSLFSNKVLKKFVKEGVKTIISLLETTEKKIYSTVNDDADKYDDGNVYSYGSAKANEVNLVNIPIEDGSIPTFDQIDKAMKVIENGLKKGKVVIHCIGGNGRTGTIAALWWVYKKGYTGKDAIKEIRKLNKNAIETPGQKEIIELYYNLKKMEKEDKKKEIKLKESIEILDEELINEVTKNQFYDMYAYSMINPQYLKDHPKVEDKILNHVKKMADEYIENLDKMVWREAKYIKNKIEKTYDSSSSYSSSSQKTNDINGNEIKEGDEVSVFRKPTREELRNWNDIWVRDMDPYVGDGKFYKVVAISNTGVKIGNAWSFPAFILKKKVNESSFSRLLDKEIILESVSFSYFEKITGIKEDDFELLTSNWKEARKKGNISLEQIYKIFKKFDWESGYGGENWAKITRYLIGLKKSREKNDYKGMMEYMDFIHNAQHNTGSVFTKWNPEDKPTAWIDSALYDKAIKSSLPILWPKLSGQARTTLGHYFRERKALSGGREGIEHRKKISPEEVRKEKIEISKGKDTRGKKYSDHFISIDEKFKEFKKYIGKKLRIGELDDFYDSKEIDPNKMYKYGIVKDIVLLESISAAKDNSLINKKGNIQSRHGDYSPSTVFQACLLIKFINSKIKEKDFEAFKNEAEFNNYDLEPSIAKYKNDKDKISYFSAKETPIAFIINQTDIKENSKRKYFLMNFTGEKNKDTLDVKFNKDIYKASDKTSKNKNSFKVGDIVKIVSNDYKRNEYPKYTSLGSHIKIGWKAKITGKNNSGSGWNLNGLEGESSQVNINPKNFIKVGSKKTQSSENKKKFNKGDTVKVIRANKGWSGWNKVIDKTVGNGKIYIVDKINFEGNILLSNGLLYPANTLKKVS